MKTTMKKVLSIALALVLVLGMLPMGTLAAEAGVVAHAHDVTKDTCGIDGCTYQRSMCAAGHTFDGTYSYDETNHWQVCTKCLNWFNTNAHTGGAANCTTKKVCDVCKQSYGEVDSTAHTGGTASCNAQPVCDRCKTPYGDWNGTNHIRTEVRNRTEATCTANGYSGDTWCLDCNTKIATGSTITATGHSWEAATATTPEVCSICKDTQGAALGSSTINVIVVMGGVSQNGGSFTMTAGSTKTASDILNAFLATSTYSASTISSYYVTANGTQLTGNQTLDLAAASTYTLTITPANNVNNNYTNNNPTVISVGFVPNYNTYTYATYVASPIQSGARIYSIPHNITRTGYTLEGWYYDAALTQKVPTDAVVTGSTTVYAKWTQVAPYNVSVVIYTNGNKTTPTVTLDLYSWAQDGVITLDDVKAAVAQNGIKANNNAGLSVYGPFTPNQWTSYVSHDYFRNSTERVSVNSGEATVLYAMVHNVKITKGSVDPYGAIADKTNPKTGDMIYAPMMVLGLSASALAVLFYLNKKRAF